MQIKFRRASLAGPSDRSSAATRPIANIIQGANVDRRRSDNPFDPLNTGEAHQRHAPRETSSNDHRIYPTPLLSAIGQQWSRPCPPCGIRTGKSWNGLPFVPSGKAQLEQIRSK
jgi:hypothetical protein